MRAMRLNLAWAVGYNAIALLITAGSSNLSSGWSCVLGIVALSMFGFSFMVAVNAFMLLTTPTCPSHPPNP